MRRMILLVLVLSFAGCGVDRRNTIVVGSKNFTEQAILGEIVAQHLEARTKLNVVRRFYLAGSYICQQALLTGTLTPTLNIPALPSPPSSRIQSRATEPPFSIACAANMPRALTWW